MKICFCITRFKTDLKEAISKNVFCLADSMTDKNKITIIAPNKADDTEYEIVNIGLFDKKISYNSIKYNLLSIRRIAMYINSNINNYDIFSVHIAPIFESIILRFFLSVEAYSKIILTIWQPYMSLREFRSNYSFYLSHFWSQKHHFFLNSFLLYPLFKYGLCPHQYLVVQSKYQSRQLKHLSKNVNVIGNGIKIGIEELSVSKRNVKHILNIGHLKASKGIYEVIEIFHEICKIDSSYRLILAPTGLGKIKKVKQMIEKYGISSKVKWKFDIDVYEEMSKAGAMFVPYKTFLGTSQYPNVLLEALGSGLPLITTNISTVKEIVDNSVNGVLLDLSRSKNESAQLIVEFLNSKSAYSSVALEARRKFRHNFDIQLVYKKYLRLFHERVEFQ